MQLHSTILLRGRVEFSASAGAWAELNAVKNSHQPHPNKYSNATPRYYSPFPLVQ